MSNVQHVIVAVIDRLQSWQLWSVFSQYEQMKTLIITLIVVGIVIVMIVILSLFPTEAVGLNQGYLLHVKSSLLLRDRRV